MTERRVMLVERMMQVLAEMGGVLDQVVNLVRMRRLEVVIQVVADLGR